MDNEKKPSGGLPTTGLWLAALVAAGAYFVHEAPLLGSRPVATDPRAYTAVARQDVDARLWQDPLTAVAAARDAALKKVDGDSARAAAETRERIEHDPSRFASALADGPPPSRPPPQPPLVVGVMAQGGPYAEAIEARRRTRYAVLAGLSKHGYTPEDAAHLGYVLPLRSTDAAALPDFVAYEWFDAPGRSHALVVVWLDEYVFGTRTLERIARLRDALAVAGEWPWVVVGPTYSSTLHDMAARAQPAATRPARARVASPPSSERPPPAFYAYGASSSDRDILRDTPLASAASLHDSFASIRLDVFRTVVPDDRLVEALKGELDLRGVKAASNPCDETRLQRIVLIAEWDTLYGRTLPSALIDTFAPGQQWCGRDAVPAVLRYSYLRGLDGQAPALDSRDAGTGKDADRGGGGSRPTDRAELQRQIERPDGQGQLDYLRRMAHDLQALDRRLQREGKGSIAAVGVVGSDVFDKLLILQALRPEFPDAVFFTTDLDARLQHPLEQAWARNVIVASSFGLTLRPELQLDIPPFRDTYETSAYLSTLIALYNSDGSPHRPPLDQGAIDDLVVGPRLFEVGRNAPFDYSRTALDLRTIAEGRRPSWPPTLSACAGPIVLAECAEAQPLRTPMTPSSNASLVYKRSLLVVVVAVIAGIAWAAVVPAPDPARAPARGTDAEWRSRRRRRWVRIGSVTVLAAAMLAAALIFEPARWWATAASLTDHGEGEPMSFMEGISIWPTELIRGLVVLVSILFVAVSWRRLSTNLQEISERFEFKPQLHAALQDVKKQYRQWPRTRRLVRIFSPRLEEFGGGPARIEGLSWRGLKFWEKYLYQGMLVPRLCRVLVAVVIFGGAGLLLMSSLGMPGTPYRGETAKLVNDRMLKASVFAMLFTIFFVVDAMIFCYQFVRALKNDVFDEDGEAASTPSCWAEPTFAAFSRRFGATPDETNAIILLDFIAARTKAVSGLIYFPFGLIAMMILSRSHSIDNWTIPIGLTIIFGTAVFIVVVSAFALRRAAETARDAVLDMLETSLVHRKLCDPARAPQTEALIARTRGLRTGAFAPYSQQPLLRALLLPLSTLGGPALLDFLSSTSF